MSIAVTIAAIAIAGIGIAPIAVTIMAAAAIGTGTIRVPTIGAPAVVWSSGHFGSARKPIQNQSRFHGARHERAPLFYGHSAAPSVARFPSTSGAGNVAISRPA